MYFFLLTFFFEFGSVGSSDVSRVSTDGDFFGKKKSECPVTRQLFYDLFVFQIFKAKDRISDKDQRFLDFSDLLKVKSESRIWTEEITFWFALRPGFFNFTILFCLCSKILIFENIHVRKYSSSKNFIFKNCHVRKIFTFEKYSSSKNSIFENCHVRKIFIFEKLHVRKISLSKIFIFENIPVRKIFMFENIHLRKISFSKIFMFEKW